MKNDKNYKYILTFTSLILLIIFSTTSCITPQDAYNNDGIYGSQNSNKEVVLVKDSKSDYYQEYFSGESGRYEIDEDDVFTDIDNYEGYAETDTLYVEDQYNEGYAPWDYNTDVSINFYGGFGYYGYGGYWG